MVTPSTLIIVDDDPRFLTLCQAFFSQTSDYDCIGTATNGQAGVALWRETHPDLTLMDLNMPIMPGVEAIRAIRRDNPVACIVALTSMTDINHIEDALREGAEGYIIKGCPPEEFLGSVRDALDGKRPLAADARRVVVDLLQANGDDAHRTTDGETISGREKEILGFLAEGMSNRQIGQKMKLSESSVKQYVNHLFVKFNATSRLELVVAAVRQGVVRL